MARRDRVVGKAILPVADMAAAVDFYSSLGLEVQHFDRAYAWVVHDGEEVLHLRLVDGLDVGANRASAYLHIRDADRWHERLSASGLDVGPILDQPWGMREFELTDLAGNLLPVASPSIRIRGPT